MIIIIIIELLEKFLQFFYYGNAYNSNSVFLELHFLYITDMEFWIRNGLLNDVLFSCRSSAISVIREMVRSEVW